MRLLLDQGLPRSTVLYLHNAGIDAAHVGDRGLATAGLYLRALEDRSHHLSALIYPHLGNRLAKGSDVMKMEALVQSSPDLEITNMKQLAALPLGSRIKLDPWDDHVEMQKSKPVALLSARDKMPFEVTPMMPNLVRFKTPGSEVAAKQGSSQQ